MAKRKQDDESPLAVGFIGTLLNQKVVGIGHGVSSGSAVEYQIVGELYDTIVLITEGRDKVTVSVQEDKLLVTGEKLPNEVEPTHSQTLF
jgi:hypothetical protein